MPFKCFNCGTRGNFASKHPYAKLEEINDEIKHKNGGKFHKNKKGISLKKKSLYSKEDGNSLEESDEHASDDD